MITGTELTNVRSTQFEQDALLAEGQDVPVVEEAAETQKKGKKDKKKQEKAQEADEKPSKTDKKKSEKIEKAQTAPIEKVVEETESLAISEEKKKPAPAKKSNPALGALKQMLAAKQALEEEQRRQEEEERRILEEEQRKIDEEEKKRQEIKMKKKEKEKAKKEELKKSGKLMTKSEKEKAAMSKLKLQQLMEQQKLQREQVQNGSVPMVKEEVKEIEEKQVKVYAESPTKTAADSLDLRSPICCILGHVDTGKTKLLDKIRQTNVQEGEAGGITQQIGATYFPVDIIKQKTAELTKVHDLDFQVPGLLIIDTPGHESFTNLRSRGSSLCNIAILVVDLMHGLEPQTIESINLLKMRKTPFVVALNKIDRLFGWKAEPNAPFQVTLAKQPENVLKEFQDRLSKTILAFAEQGLNAALYYENEDVRKYVSLIPTSAITGEGIPDLLYLIVQLTQKMMSKSLMYLSALECTVLEVKCIEGLGTTIDVILSNGIIREGDKIVVCGLNGPIVTHIRALLTPQPLRELRIKGQYVHHKEVKAALGVKICAQDLDKCLAGSRLLVVRDGDDEEEMCEEVMEELNQMLNSVDKSGLGVCVQASTIGSLEALLQFLKDMKIPVSGVSIGPVHKKDVTRASVMVEKAKEFATMLCFDVKIDKDALDLAEELEVKIFKADIIYHLFDQFTAYMKDITEQKKKDLAPQAVFPCILKIVPGCVFNKRSPLVLGVQVVEGILRVGTPICVPSQGNVMLGRVSSIEANHKPLDQVKKGGPSVAIKLEVASYETPRMFGRHFSESDELVSKVCFV